MLISVGRECATTKKFLRDVCAESRRRKNFFETFARTRDDVKTSPGRLREVATMKKLLRDVCAKSRRRTRSVFYNLRRRRTRSVFYILKKHGNLLGYGIRGLPPKNIKAAACPPPTEHLRKKKT
jgi:hypothetical protein